MVKKRNRDKDNAEDFLLIIGALFSSVAFLHFIRAFFNWNMIIGNFHVPAFWSWYLFFTSAFFAFVSFSLVKKIK